MTHDNRLWAAYVRAVAPGLKQQEIAERINKRYEGGDIKQGTISRWLDPNYASAPEPARVAAFAQAFKKPVLQAFFAAGLLELKDIERGVDGDEVAYVLDLRRKTHGKSIRRSTPAGPKDRMSRSRPPQK